MAWTGSSSNWGPFMKMLSPLPGDRILDVGAGKGKVAYRVLRETKDAQVYAVEPNAKRVAAMNRDAPGVSGKVGSAEKLPFEDSSFDKVYTTMAAHHFADLDQALTEFARVLKDGGRLVILDADPGHGTGRIASFFENKVMRHHTKFRTPEEMVERLQASGRFRVWDSFYGSSGYIIQGAKV